MTPHALRSSFLLIGVLLAAHTATADTAADPASKRSQTQPTAAAGMPGTHESAGPAPASVSAVQGSVRTSKTALGLRIDYAFDAPATGSTTEVRLKVGGNPSGRPLSIEVVPGSGLKMARGTPGSIARQSVPSVSSEEHVIAITPTADGLHYLHVFLRSGAMTEALAIAVPTGKAQSLAKPVATQTMPDGRRVKAIPAQQ